MQTTYAHRCVNPGQPQRVPDVHFSAERCSRYDQTCAFYRESAVNCQAEGVIAGQLTRRQLQQVITQRFDTTAFTGGSHEQYRIGKTIVTQRGLHLGTYFVNACVIDAIGFCERHGKLWVARQLQDLQVFTRLRHHAIITGHHQQRVVDTTDTRQHVGQKLFVSRDIDKSQYPPIRLRPVGIAEVDSHATLFFFRQSVGIHAGNRL